jgi:allantoinase
MRPRAFALRSARIVTPEGERAGVLTVRDGRIHSITPEAPKRVPLRELGFLAVLPGVVDTHVHVNEPGRTEWEGFATATRAAAAGGVTTFVDMPLHSIPPTTTPAALEAKRAAARGRVYVDCAFWAGIVPGGGSDLPALLAAGARGAKACLAPSGSPEFPASDPETLRSAMIVLKASNAPLLADAELLDSNRVRPASAPAYSAYLASRPRSGENEAVSLLVSLCRETGARAHIVHLSSSDAVAILREARAAGLPISAETCPHYLTFAAESIPDRSPAFKCAPPIRERENRERLWQGLREGAIEMVVSDHSPCAPDLKSAGDGDFMAARGGISSLQFSLSATWTGAMARGFDLGDLSRWMAQAPARLAGLHSRKGAIAPGMDADLAIFDPDETYAVAPEGVLHRHPLTPYLGMRLSGVVLETYVRGHKVYDHGSFGRPHGELL